jgi:glycosyltransferase involved in cell wall biosynthesis
MKASILIPTFNRAYIIGDAIKSALAQTFRDFEIVIVDDGSSDNTREIVERFQDERIRYVQHEFNKGCSAACNTAVESARGEIVAFLDSDDVWKPEYLERQVNFLNSHSGVDIVFSDMELQERDKTFPSLMQLMVSFPKLLRTKPAAIEYVIPRREMYLCLLEEVPIKPTATVMKRTLFAKTAGFNESWPSGTDWDLFLRMSQLTDFGYINEPLVLQRRTPDATHQKFREKDKIFLLQTFLEEKAKLGNDPEAIQAVNRGISSHCMILAGLYFAAGERQKSMSVYLRAFRETHDPMMILRAFSSSLSPRVRESLKKGFRALRSSNSTSH